MSFSIRNNKLLESGRLVDQVKSIFDSGKFPNIPKIIVMHFTYGASAASSAGWFRDRRNAGSSAHIVIDRDGTVIQCVDFDVIAWHAGASRLRNLVGMNRHAFGIEMSNWGYLQQTPSGWRSHTGLPIAGPILAVHKNGNPPASSRGPIGWEPYPDKQVLVAAEIARALVATYAVNEIVGHDDVSPDRKWDPGPAFDLPRFRGLVFGGRGSNDDSRLKVDVQAGLNLRRGAGTNFDVIKTLAKGDIVDPIRSDGVWLEVSVIDAAGHPTDTGWVHSAYLTAV